MTRHFSRRDALGSGLAVGATIGLLRVVGGNAQTPEASPVSGAFGWTFTDDRGVTVTLADIPAIAAQTTAAVSLAAFGVPIVAHFGTEDPRQAIAFPDQSTIDLTGWRFLGPWGEFDFEALVASGAGLYVDLYRGENAEFWAAAGEIQAQLAEIIPAIGISTFAVTMKESVQRFEELAASLGADLSSQELMIARQNALDAETALKAAIVAKPGLKVLGVTGDPSTNAFILNPEGLGDLLYFHELGLDIVVPENPDPAQLNVFETLSWEQVGKYPAGVILYDSRFDPPIDDPIWQSLPAVQAGQVGSWYASTGYSWQELALYLQSLTATIEAATVLS